jgi:hypothetical protein
MKHALTGGSSVGQGIATAMHRSAPTRWASPTGGSE